MKKIIKIMLVLLMMLIPMEIKGACSVEDKMRLNNLASNITTSYDYIENGDNVSFSITIHNVHKDLVIIDNSTEIRYESNTIDLNNFVISNLKDGSNYSFGVYAKNSDCSYRLFNTLYVSLPKYNKYYKDDVCIGASDYNYCQKWAEIGDLSYEEFKANVLKYKQETIEEGEEENEEQLHWLYKIGDIWSEYYLYILGGIIIIMLPIIFMLNKRNNFDF